MSPHPGGEWRKTTQMCPREAVIYAELEAEQFERQSHTERRGLPTVVRAA